jgi:hypothetical protein
MDATRIDDDSEPTSVPPSFRVAAVASVAGLRDTCGNVPLDTCIPVRRMMPIPTDLQPQSEWVLLHVDGGLSVQEIAVRTELSLPDAIAACLDLLAHGLVDVPLPGATEEET